MVARFGVSVLPPMEHLGHTEMRIDPYATGDPLFCIVAGGVLAEWHWHAACFLR